MNKKHQELNIHSWVCEPKCCICEKPCAYIEIVAPDCYSRSAEKMTETELENYDKYRDFSSAYLIYSGPGGSNGVLGNPIDSVREISIKNASTSPYEGNELRGEFHDLAGFCDQCEAFYCSTHWNSRTTGRGRCPKGHFKSLDPHWSPDD